MRSNEIFGCDRIFVDLNAVQADEGATGIHCSILNSDFLRPAMLGGEEGMKLLETIVKGGAAIPLAFGVLAFVIAMQHEAAVRFGM
jgi:hypothetical protein